jgi:amidophosphoribosyltransferase
MFASESVVLDVLGYTQDIKDVEPGECTHFFKFIYEIISKIGQVVIVTRQGVSVRQCVPLHSTQPTPCIFEYVYFARPDSIINGISVYKSRLAMGEALANQVRHAFGDSMDIDVVIPVPDTSRVAALQLSYKLNLLYREGFIKNRYVGRTFIMPGQTERKKSVRRKLNAMPMEFAGKNVLLVDGMMFNFDWVISE